MPEIAGGANRLRTEASTRPIGGAAIEGRTDDDHVGALKGDRIIEIGFRNPEECVIRAVLTAVTSHIETVVSLTPDSEPRSRGVTY